MATIPERIAAFSLLVALAIPLAGGCSPTARDSATAPDSPAVETDDTTATSSSAGVREPQSRAARPDDREPASETAEDDPRAVAYLEQAGVELERDERGRVLGVRAVGVSLDSASEVLSKLAGLPHLEKLVLAGTPLSHDDLNALGALDNLRELDLFDTEIGDESLSVLSRLPRLERLSLSGTRISDAAISQLSQVRQLRELDLRWTDITGDSIEGLASLPQLSQLDMSWTLVSDDQVEQLAMLKSVDRLILEYTEISNQGIQRLREAMGETEIVAQDAVAAAIRTGDRRDYRLIGAGVGDRYRLLDQEYRASWNEFLQRYGAAARESQRAEIAERAPSARPTAERMLKLAEENPEHSAAVDALVWIMQAEERSVKDLQEVVQSRLTEQYVDHPRLGEMCLQLSMSTSPPAQSLLRGVKEKSSVNEIRGRATLGLAESLAALAERARQVQAMDEVTRNRTIHLEGLLVVGQLLDADPEQLTGEAERLYEEVLRDFADVDGLDATLGERAEARLAELRKAEP